RALAKSPDERQETCAAFVEELEEAARRIGASQLPTPPALASDGVRVLVFAPSDDVRTTIVPVLGRALRRFGSAVEIECVERESDFVRAFGRSRADIVIVDDDAPGRRADALVAGLRHAQGGRDAEVLLLGGNRSAARLDELGARELPRPLSSQVLGVALARMGDRIVERRARADRREP
ncbi:MAG TPA: hypothetical protein VIF62_01825, partial [Labilithrix sp.]